MPVITNVGGSITSAVALTLLAWAVRFIRSRAERQRRRRLRGAPASAPGGRFFATLSPAALRMLVRRLGRTPRAHEQGFRPGSAPCTPPSAGAPALSCGPAPGSRVTTWRAVLQVETQPLPHVVLDVRSAKNAAQAPLPADLQAAVHLPGARPQPRARPPSRLRPAARGPARAARARAPSRCRRACRCPPAVRRAAARARAEQAGGVHASKVAGCGPRAAGEVAGVLRARCAAWPARVPAAPAPGRDWLLVCLAEGEAEARGAAAEAAAAGFERGVALEGGLGAYARAAHAQARSTAQAGAPPRDRRPGPCHPPRRAGLGAAGRAGHPPDARRPVLCERRRRAGAARACGAALAGGQRAGRCAPGGARVAGARAHRHEPGAPDSCGAGRRGAARLSVRGRFSWRYPGSLGRPG